MRKRDKILAFILFILVDISLIGGILYIRRATAKNNFYKEIEELSLLNFKEDKFDTSIKATGEYGKLEEKIKEFLGSYASMIQDVIDYENDDLDKLLNTENYSKDGPLFVDSQKKIEDERCEFNAKIDKVIEETGDERINKKLHEYLNNDSYFEFVYDVLYDNGLFDNLENSLVELESKRVEVNAYFDSVKDVLVFLRDRNGSYTINGVDVIFNDNNLALEYEKLMKSAKRISE